jgi:hypothetical protein
MRALFIAVLWVGLTGCPEDAAAKRAQERLKKVEAEKADRKKRSAELDEKRQNALKGEPKLGPPWDDAKILVPDAPCPLGFWALLPGAAPGGDEVSRGGFAGALRADMYRVKLRAPEGVALTPFDSAKGELGVEVKGSMECKDPAGRVTIAWTSGKPGAAAPPVALPVPMASAATAKEWADKNGPGLRATVVFKLTNGEAPGGARVVHAELLGVRVTAEEGRTLVVEKKVALPAAEPQNAAPQNAEPPTTETPE